MPAAVAENAKALAASLQEQGLAIVSGGTDNHLMLVDLRPPRTPRASTPKRRSTGPRSPATRTASPTIREKPFVTSGIRLGTPAGTTRGFGVAEFRQIGGLIAEVVEGLREERRGRRRAGRTIGARAR